MICCTVVCHAVVCHLCNFRITKKNNNGKSKAGCKRTLLVLPEKTIAQNKATSKERQEGKEEEEEEAEA